MSVLLLPDDNEALAAMVQDSLLELAAANARAEAAERELSDERGHKDVIYAGFQAAKQRHAELEAKLAAVPAESLQRIFDAWRMRGQPLQYDMDAAFRWLAQQSEAQP